MRGRRFFFPLKITKSEFHVGFPTVDGRNPASVDRWFIPLFIGFQHVSTIQGGAGFLPSTVVQTCTKCCDVTVVTRVSACLVSPCPEVPAGRTDNAQLDVHLSHFYPHRRRWEIPGTPYFYRPMMTNVSRKKSDSWFLAWLAAFFYVLGRVFQLRKNDAQRLWSFPDLIPCFIGTQCFDPETILWNPATWCQIRWEAHLIRTTVA